MDGFRGQKKRNKRTVYLISILALFLFILGAETSLAEVEDYGCCIFVEGGECVDSIYVLDCPSPNQFFLTQDCSDVAPCYTEGCCQLEGGDCKPTLEAQCQGGNFTPGLGPADCEAMCNENLIVVEGYANYSGGQPAPGAIIFFNQSNVIIDQATSGISGYYAVDVAGGNTYNVTATIEGRSPDCDYSGSISVNLPSPVTYNILLPCSQDAYEGCETHWNVGPWENTEDSCGNRDVWADNNCDPITYWNKPIDYIPCDETDNFCGNMYLDSELGEECDPMMFPQIQDPLLDQCSDYPEFGPFASGSVYCSFDCKIMTMCSICPEDTNGCTEVGFCGCDICQSNYFCQDTCESWDNISNFRATSTYTTDPLEKVIKLDWTVPSLCLNGVTTIKRCKGNVSENKCNGTLQLRDTILGSVQSYTDDEIPDAWTKVCYNISLEFNNGNPFNITTDTGGVLVCANVIDDDCLQNPTGKFCKGNELITCEYGFVVKNETCSCTCIDATENTVAMCINNLNDGSEYCDICDLCNGPFGLFGYKNDLVLTLEETPYTCAETLEYTEAEEGTMPPYCYVDDYSKMRAVIGGYQRCSEIKSCYDYYTKGSCEENPCGVIKTEDCKWMSLPNPETENNELGLGVCIPKNITEQDCTRCSSGTMLGNYCPEELCLMYGYDESTGNSTCFYNDEISSGIIPVDNVSCMSINDVACETYDTKDECIGETGDFNASIIYEEQEIIWGNNQVITLSNDTLQKGKCVWIEKDDDEDSKCIRDADNTYKYAGENTKSDCDNYKTKKSCYLDFTNPQTELFIGGVALVPNGEYSKAELKALAPNVSEQADTYYSIYPDTAGEEYEYPASTLQELLSEIETMPYPPVSMPYKISFFSEDSSKNRELVQTMTIKVLPELQIQITTDTESEYYETLDMYLTNLIVEVSSPANLPLICSAVLKETDPNKTFMGDAIKIYPGLIWEYPLLPDGNYIIFVTCVDEHMRSDTVEKSIPIEADISLYNPLPRGERFNAGDIDIEISSRDAAVCYYNTNQSAYLPPGSGGGGGGSGGDPWTGPEGDDPEPEGEPPGEDEPEYYGWIKYNITGETYHSAIVYAGETGMNYYYTACYYEGITEPFRGNGGDTIYFAVDELPPVPEIYDAISQTIYDPEMPPEQEKLSLTLSCVDYTPLLEGAINYSWGCADYGEYNVYYEEDGEIVDTSSIYEWALGQTIELNAPVEDYDVYLNITVSDIGGNSNTSQILLGLRSTPPNISLFDANKDELFDNSTPNDTLTLYITCYDGESEYVFGCEDDVAYNIYYRSPRSPYNIKQVFPTQVIPYEETFTLNAPANYSLIYINITGSDLGGNEVNQNIFLNLRNLSFLPPEIIICNPDTGECT